MGEGKRLEMKPKDRARREGGNVGVEKGKEEGRRKETSKKGEWKTVA